MLITPARHSLRTTLRRIEACDLFGFKDDTTSVYFFDNKGDFRDVEVPSLSGFGPWRHYTKACQGKNNYKGPCWFSAVDVIFRNIRGGLDEAVEILRDEIGDPSRTERWTGRTWTRKDCENLSGISLRYDFTPKQHPRFNGEESIHNKMRLYAFLQKFCFQALRLQPQGFIMSVLFFYFPAYR